MAKYYPSPRVIKEVRRRYAKGQEALKKYKQINVNQIADKFEISRTTVLTIEKGFDPHKHRHKLTLDDVYLILDLLEEMRKYQAIWRKNNIPALCKEFGISKTSMSLMTRGVTYKGITP
jgi:DNA-binding XRE family transcriptional regulator